MDRQDKQNEKLLLSLRSPSRSAFGRSRLGTNNPVHPVHRCESGIYSCSTPKPKAASGVWPQRLSPGWRSGAPCCRRLRGSTLRRAFHGLTPTAKCCRRFAARLESPGWRPGDYHCLYRRPSGAWQFGKRGSPWSTVLSPPTRLNSYADLSMGSRPRLSAGAAFAARLEPAGVRPGIIIIEKSCPEPNVVILGRAA